MHTVKVIAAGFALLGALLLIAPRLNTGGRHPIVFAMKLFIPLWFVASVINLIIGINRAGYTFLQEVPILLVVFGVPALVAGLVWWRFGRGVS
ncbi:MULTISPECIES: hypothetical protein [unclassified Bosea (in: a-proteobacteria)]|uniref:hypothetical protein n=1 Tax=unclassified Bosea (in: a-proteobacteria) TaxID=2653178 RepID=UPI000F75C7B0|nr:MULTISPECIES: hypothetical protein [unclassified Bosea (in: a-proteobacteria)]AZO79971.1 hypothetical protein BLM15_22030 [Bosea sp. Tri-49]RXT22749.1 hypothetical protein B5U98_08820 [Bosea sp. Tri-39]RXT38218.1 hypothetical protein B5U99_08270 [Bosea sp. Tri-54]